MKDQLFRTTSFKIASLLLAKGFLLEAIEPTPIPKKKSFVFEDKPERKQLITDFYNGTVSVNAKFFSDAERQLKEMLYDQPQGGEML